MKVMTEEKDSDETRRRLESTYRTERTALLRKVRRSGTLLADAEDIVQDAFVAALSGVEALSPVRNTSAWLTTAVSNRIIDLWRRERTRREAGQIEVTEEIFEEIVSETGLDPQDEFVREELLEALIDAIEALPARQRAVITGQVFEGLTFRELSERTGVPLETLAARKRAAIRSLGAALREWIIED